MLASSGGGGAAGVAAVVAAVVAVVVAAFVAAVVAVAVYGHCDYDKKQESFDHIKDGFSDCMTGFKLCSLFTK